MTVRLAFAVMIQADTDILLIDEVLAVGDASFQQKCADVFHGMRESGKTVVLVTHDMGSVETYCDRAMLIHDGDVVISGDPDEVARNYYRINFEAAAADPDAAHDAPGRARPSTTLRSTPHTKVLEARLEDERRRRGRQPRAGRADPVPSRVRGRRGAPQSACSRSSARAATAPTSSASGARSSGATDEVVIVDEGERIELAGTVENPLDARALRADLLDLARRGERARSPSRRSRLADFMVYGSGQPLGLVDVEADVEATTVDEGADMSEELAAGTRNCASSAVPRAIGGGRRRFFDLLFLTATNDFKKAFFGTALGYAWSLLRPLLLFGVLLVVFTKIFRVGSATSRTIRSSCSSTSSSSRFFQETTNVATFSVAAREGIVRKTQFPRLVIPLSIVLTRPVQPRHEHDRRARLHARVRRLSDVVVAAVPARPAAADVVLTAAVSTGLSALYVRRRDIGIIWSVVLDWRSSTAAPCSDPDQLRRAGLVTGHPCFFNPLVPILVQTHKWIIDPRRPERRSRSPAAGSICCRRRSIFVGICVCRRSGSSTARRRGSPRSSDRVARQPAS